MPSQSQAQHGLMELIAHGGTPRGGHGPSQAVARDFVAADKGKKTSSLPKHVRAAAQRKVLEG